MSHPFILCCCRPILHCFRTFIASLKFKLTLFDTYQRVEYAVLFVSKQTWAWQNRNRIFNSRNDIVGTFAAIKQDANSKIKEIIVLSKFIWDIFLQIMCVSSVSENYFCDDSSILMKNFNKVMKRTLFALNCHYKYGTLINSCE